MFGHVALEELFDIFQEYYFHGAELAVGVGSALGPEGTVSEVVCL